MFLVSVDRFQKRYHHYISTGLHTWVPAHQQHHQVKERARTTSGCWAEWREEPSWPFPAWPLPEGKWALGQLRGDGGRADHYCNGHPRPPQDPAADFQDDSDQGEWPLQPLSHGELPNDQNQHPQEAWHPHPGHSHWPLPHLHAVVDVFLVVRGNAFCLCLSLLSLTFIYLNWLQL